MQSCTGKEGPSAKVGSDKKQALLRGPLPEWVYIVDAQNSKGPGFFLQICHLKDTERISTARFWKTMLLPH